ncbi:hypothetical protein OE09_2411 [Flavobacteriaceae bacterium MAR_2010_72]|nr:hypothetical protein OE09_2411 [Flavobacteriaceae bacterium MAR_2010_72]TVZ58881.1 hypothetical protein NA63_1396 [Flavobacteriaceae bacterium MAR_2010_105]
MKKNVFFISCEEAQHICDKSQYGEATLWEKFKLNIRLTWCRITRAYTKKNQALTKTIKTSKIECLKNEEQQALKKSFEEQLHQQN